MFDEFTPFDTLDAKTLSTESESTTIFLLFKCGQALKTMQHCSLFLVLCFACRQAAKNKGQGIKDMSFVFCCFFSLLFVH